MSIVTSSSGIPFMLLKDDKFYIVPRETPHPETGALNDLVRFRAKIGKVDFFKTAVAEWTWPDGKIITVSTKPFSTDLVYSEPLPFGIRFSNAAWYAPVVLYGV